jgi:hypothetical protein
MKYYNYAVSNHLFMRLALKSKVTGVIYECGSVHSVPESCTEDVDNLVPGFIADDGTFFEKAIDCLVHNNTLLAASKRGSK